MTRNQIIRAIERRLGRRSGLQEDIADELVLAQVRLERGPMLPWFLVKATSALVFTANQRGVTLPTDYLRLYEESRVFIQDVDGTNDQEVDVMDYDVLLGDDSLASTTVTNGKPTHLAFVGSTAYGFPKPNAAYPINFFYYGAGTPTFDEETAVGSENAWAKYAPDVIIGEAGFNIASALGEDRAMNLFKMLRDESLARLATDDIARKESGVAKFLGG